MENYTKTVFIALALMLSHTTSFSQNQPAIDSLLNALKVTQTDTLQINLLIEIGDAYQYHNNDSTLFYYRKALNIAKETNKPKEISDCCVNLGIIYMELGQFDSALVNYNYAITEYAKVNHQPGIALCYHNLGYLYNIQGKFEIALEHYLKSLKIKELINDKEGMAKTYLNIGKSYGEQELYSHCIEYFLKASALYEELGNNISLIKAYLNIGTTYYFLNDYNQALTYYLKAINLSNKYGNQVDQLMCAISIGNLYKELGEFDKAISYSVQAVELAIKTNIKERQVDAYLGLGSLYSVLADSNYRGERALYSKLALDNGLKGYNLATELNLLYQINNAASTLVDIYKGMGNYKKALEYSDIYISTNDSLFHDDFTNSIAEMEAKYQNEKKQKEIEILEKDSIINKEKAQKQKIIIASILFGLGVLVFLITFVLRRLQITRKQKLIIEEKNLQLIELNDEITAQSYEIEAQRDMVTDQKEEIERIHKDLSQSIDYAQRLQMSMLPDERLLQTLCEDYFIIYSPKDKVSGDFYWWAVVENHFILAVADCTGHGVPGAFMSMLGTSFLREIVVKEGMPNPGIILKRLRKEIIHALKQKGTPGEQKDGMDMTLVSININTLELQFAGANNPLWIVSPSLNPAQPAQFTELKADKMPVAIYQKMDPFTTQTFQLQKGDALYFSTDGYKDQFGGPENKKFMVKQMRELIIANAHNTMDEQKTKLLQTLHKWKGNTDQIDDITVLGIKI